jgi:hypothetical protein
MDVQLERLEKDDEAADKLWNETYGEPENKEPIDAPKDEPKVEDTPSKETELPKEEQTLKEEETPKEPSTPPADDKKNEELYEKKFKTLEGKYKAEVPRTIAERDQARREAAEARAEAEKLRAEIEAVKTAKQSDTVDAKLEELARDYPSMAETLKEFKAMHDDKLKAVEERFSSGVKAERDAVQSEVAGLSLSRFETDMARLAGEDWKDIDISPEFEEWLNAKVPYTKLTKRQVLEDAARRHEADIVAQFFTDYKETVAKKDDTPSPEDGGDPSQKKLEKFVAPPKGGGGGTPPGGGQQGITRESYAKFMDETTRGKFDPKKWGGRTEEQVEKSFDDAIIAGKLSV